MNAIDLLEQQHEETLAILKALESSEPGAQRREQFKEMRSALLAHMLIEEELFYPRVAHARADEREVVAEGYEEHTGARGVLERCGRALADKELFCVRIGVLREMVMHHIAEEREQMFPKAREAMAGEDLERLGEEMEARFITAKNGPSPASRLNRLSTLREKQALSA